MRSALILAIGFLLAAHCSGQFSNIVRFSSSSSASCTATASGSSSSSAQDAVSYVDSGLEVGKELCTGQGVVEREGVVELSQTVSVTVQDVAEAFAKAVVRVAGSCVTRGNAQGHAQAYAKAEAEAKATATAMAQGFAQVESCDKCKAAAGAFASSVDSVFVSAVAEAELNIHSISDDGGSDEIHKEEVVEDIQQATAMALSTVMLQVAKSYDGDCSAVAVASTVAGTSNATCAAITLGNVDEISTVAIAEAGANAAASACGENDETVSSTSHAIATGVATATASALSFAEVICETNGNSRACGVSSVAVKAVAVAQAQAFAAAYATAEDRCGCNVAVDAVAKDVQEILVEAASDAYAETCSEGDSEAQATALSSAMTEITVVALAEAISSASVGKRGCTGAAEALTQTAVLCSECANVFEVCAGSEEGVVKPCCIEQYHCFLKDGETQATCQPVVLAQFQPGVAIGCAEAV